MTKLSLILLTLQCIDEIALIMEISIGRVVSESIAYFKELYKSGGLLKLAALCGRIARVVQRPAQRESEGQEM